MTTKKSSDERRCVLLLSGGIDSVSLVPLLRQDNLDIFPLFCDYGQASRINERRSAERFALALTERPLKVVGLSLWKEDHYRLLSGSKTSNFGSFFLPFRNLALATGAAAYATEVDARLIAFGFNVDGTFSDTGTEFADAIDAALKLSALPDKPVRLWRRASGFSKADLIENALRAGVPLEATYSCYRPTRCGVCSSCIAVSNAFESLKERFDNSQLDAHNPGRVTAAVERPSEHRSSEQQSN